MEEQTLFSVDEPELIPLPGQLAFFPETKPVPPIRHRARQYPDLKPVRLQDPHLVRILICIVLYRLDSPIPESWLYDILVSAGHINFFLYTDALGFLLENQSVVQQEQENETIYTLTDKGIACAVDMRQYVPKVLRDRVVLTALRFAARQKAMQEMSVTYEQVEDGYMLCVGCNDRQREMFTLRILTPNCNAAEELAERIMRNPAAFFGKLLDAALNNEEESFDLSDN